jgi:UPF0755 protein
MLDAISSASSAATNRSADPSPSPDTTKPNGSKFTRTTQPASGHDRLNAPITSHQSRGVPPPGSPTIAAAASWAVRKGSAGAAKAAGVARRAMGSSPARSSSRARPELGAQVPSPSGRQSEGNGASAMEQKRITPRSPRAALEPEEVAVPTRRSKRERNPLVIAGNAVFSLLILLTIAGGAGIVIGKSRLEAAGPLDADTVVDIPRGPGLLEIADLLRSEGVIDQNDLMFIGGVLALKARSELKHGEYLFPRHASLRDVIETMVEGKVVQHPITIAEGLTSEQIVQQLESNDVLAGSVTTVPREGSLLPGTYNEARDTTRDQVIQRMQREQQRALKDIWEHRSPDLPLKTPEQLLILASIVEKETGKPDERTRVAAVFVNRLRQKMKLQSDPTIIYGLVFGKGKLDHPITKTEKEQPTPYNTYIIDGLPPGPITNAGRASLEAVANPARTKELYFVADGAGGHVFSESYDQHQKNVAKLRGNERDGKDLAATAATADDVLEPARASAGARPAAPAAKKKKP